MKERNCTPDKPKNHIPDWVLRQFETDECRIAELEAEVEQERAAHLATLKRVEWCDTNQFHFEKENRYYSLPCCPVCGRGKRWNEHKPDCRIAAEIKRLEGE